MEVPIGVITKGCVKCTADNCSRTEEGLFMARCRECYEKEARKPKWHAITRDGLQRCVQRGGAIRANSVKRWLRQAAGGAAICPGPCHRALCCCVSGHQLLEGMGYSVAHAKEHPQPRSVE